MIKYFFLFTGIIKLDLHKQNKEDHFEVRQWAKQDITKTRIFTDSLRLPVCSCCVTVTSHFMGSPKFLSRQIESSQWLENDFTAYCIGIQHKYTIAHFVFQCISL